MGYVIALLIELLELGKRKSISQQIYDIFDSYLKDDTSFYATFYSLLFKKYMQNGIFDEFLIDVLLYRLTQVQGLITKDNLFASMDLRTFADPKKARIHAKILLDTLDELDPNIRQLLFHDIKLQYQEAMRRRLKIYHRDFEQRCFELRDQPDVIILEAICLNCDSYLLIDCQTIYYIKKSNLSPHTPILGIKCSECKQDNCILIP